MPRRSTPSSTANCRFRCAALRRQHQLRRDRRRRRRLFVVRSRHGAREFGNQVIAEHGPRDRIASTCSCRTCTGTTSWGSRSSPRPNRRQPHPHPRLPQDRCARRWCASNRRRAFRSRSARCPRRSSSSSWSPASNTGSAASRSAPSSSRTRAILRLPVFPRRQVDRLFHRLRAQGVGARRELSVRAVLPRRRPADLRTRCIRSPRRSR